LSLAYGVLADGEVSPKEVRMTSSFTFSTREWMELYARRAYDPLSERLLAALGFFAESNYTEIDLHTQRAIDTLVLNFLHLFCQPDYVPSRTHAAAFIEHNVTISNLVALSALKTSDAYLEVVRHQDQGLVKILTLYSARNNADFDRALFFKQDPVLASLWYVAFGGIYYGGLIKPDVCKNLKAHYAFAPSVYPQSDKLPDICYGVSYVDGESEQSIKPAVNRWIRAILSRTRIVNKPDPRKIAVLTCLWWPGHSSYRTNSAYVEALRDYHLTLFYIPVPGKKIDTRLFQDVKMLNFENGVLDIRPLVQNDFQLAYFPDVGMTSFSVWLANLRIAPIQVVSTGHSVSTWGADIDYYFSGASVETPDHPEKYYSERLVLLPGCGAVHAMPQFQPQGRNKTCSEFVLNCSWNSQKVNYDFCQILAQIVERSQKKLRLRLFVGNMIEGLNFVLFARELPALLKKAVVEVLPNRSYQDYMTLLEEGDLGLDAYPFGGCNTVADSLFVHKLMATCEGDRWYNRIGPRMLRMAGLPELVAPSPLEYIDLVLRLIHDDDYRQALEGRLREADLEKTIFNRADARYFRTAVNYLIANHGRLQKDKSRSPIRIEPDAG
jgi:hypothetical protein